MTKEEKKEITLGTTVKAIITGYIAYGILLGFLIYALGLGVSRIINLFNNVNYRVLSISIPLLGSVVMYFVAHGVCKLSIYDVFKKCKTNPEILPKAKTKLKIFVIALIIFFASVAAGMLFTTLNIQAKEIEVASFQLSSIHSPEFAGEQTNEMYKNYNESKENLIISTAIMVSGMILSLATVIPDQEKLIDKYNEF